MSPPYTNSKKVVCQCLSINSIIIDAPSTGVTSASIRNTKNIAIVTKGKSTLLLRKPGIAKVRLVMRRLVKDIVVLTPAAKTAIISESWLPIPVNLVLQEKGVINVQPAVVKVRLEHLVK